MLASGWERIQNSESKPRMDMDKHGFKTAKDAKYSKTFTEVNEGNEATEC